MTKSFCSTVEEEQSKSSHRIAAPVASSSIRTLKRICWRVLPMLMGHFRFRFRSGGDSSETCAGDVGRFDRNVRSIFPSIHSENVSPCLCGSVVEDRREDSCRRTDKTNAMHGDNAIGQLVDQIRLDQIRLDHEDRRTRMYPRPSKGSSTVGSR